MPDRAPEPESLAATTADRVARRMRDDILNGRFASGARLKIADFAALYGLSQMPVREALRRLEGEGLITIAAHRGATVRSIDEAFLRSIYDIREALEGILTERAAERAAPSDIAALALASRKFGEAAVRGDARAVIAHNRRFHAIIVEMAGNPEAARILETGRVLVESLRQSVGRASGRLAEIQAQHEAILDAIRQRKPEAAGRLARLHVVDARDDLIARFHAARNRASADTG